MALECVVLACESDQEILLAPESVFLFLGLDGVLRVCFCFAKSDGKWVLCVRGDPVCFFDGLWGSRGALGAIGPAGYRFQCGSSPPPNLPISL